MSAINHLPYPIYLGSLLIFIGLIIWGTSKGFHEICAVQFIYPVIEGLILGVLLIISRTSTEFHIFVPLQPTFNIAAILVLAMLLINVFILAMPRIRRDRSAIRFFIISGIVLILIICFIILAVKFPNIFD